MQDQELKKQEEINSYLSGQLSTLKAWFTVLVMVVIFTSIAFGVRYVEMFSFYESSLENYHKISLYLQDLDSDLDEQIEYLKKIDELVRR